MTMWKTSKEHFKERFNNQQYNMQALLSKKTKKLYRDFIGIGNLDPDSISNYKVSAFSADCIYI